MNFLNTLKRNSIYIKIKQKPALAQITILAISLLLTCMVIYSPNGKSEITNTSISTNSTADTHIPTGYVLIPIHVENYESLDLILGHLGVVDLYSAPSAHNSGASKLIVKAIKIIRSPQNPDQFAVLSPEGNTERILSHGNNFYVVVQNPKNIGTKFVRPKIHRPIKVIID